VTSHAAPQSTRQRAPARLWALVLAVGIISAGYLFNAMI